MHWMSSLVTDRVLAVLLGRRVRAVGALRPQHRAGVGRVVGGGLRGASPSGRQQRQHCHGPEAPAHHARASAWPPSTAGSRSANTNPSRSTISPDADGDRLAQGAARVHEGVKLAVLAAGVDACRELIEQRLRRTRDRRTRPAACADRRSAEHRAQARVDHLARQRARVAEPQRELGPEADGGQPLLAVRADVRQEQVAEDHRVDAVRPPRPSAPGPCAPRRRRWGTGSGCARRPAAARWPAPGLAAAPRARRASTRARRCRSRWSGARRSPGPRAPVPTAGRRRCPCPSSTTSMRGGASSRGYPLASLSGERSRLRRGIREACRPGESACRRPS